MEENKIIDALHSAMYGINIKKIKELKDFFKNINETDISNVNIDSLKRKKDVFEWVIENPNYDFNILFDNHYSINYNYNNKDIYDYCVLYLEKIEFFIGKFREKEFVIKFEDF